MKVQAAKKSCSTFLLIFLVASTLTLIQSVNASSSNVPMPQFTVRYIDESFDANTSPSTDPYTGETIPPTYYHVDRRYIQVSFENDLPPIPAGSPSEYYYNIRFKGQYTDDWTETRTASDEYYRASFFKTVNFSLSTFSVTGGDAPNGTKIDFQVQLMYGGIGKNLDEGPLGSLYFSGETSGWSSAQTVTVGESSSTTTAIPTSMPTLNPTDSPIQNQTVIPSMNPIQQDTQTEVLAGFDWQTVVIAVLALAVAVLAVAVAFQQRRLAKSVR